MKFLHCMVRVLDLDKALNFYCELLGMKVYKRDDYEQGRFSLVFLGYDNSDFRIELTHNWDEKEPYSMGRNFGHIALRVDDIYSVCQKLADNGVTILRPPRDGRMAFVKCPDGISIEFLQGGEPLAPKEPWQSMPSQGTW